MANESIFYPGTSPASVENNDNNQTSLGTIFDVAVPGNVKGMAVYCTGSRTITIELWSFTTRTTGTRLANASVSHTGSGWEVFNFASPVAISANTPYMVAYNKPANGNNPDYPYTSNRFSSAVTSGNVRGLADGDDTYYTDIRNGRYRYAAANNFPNSDFGATWYGPDVIFEAASTTVTSTGATTAPHATASGTAARSGNATGATTAPHATGAGTATRAGDTTGATTAPSAIAAGVAEREITTSGSGAAPGATGEGAAAKGVVSSGATTAPSATGNGEALRSMDTTGAGTAGAATGAGEAVRAGDTSGATVAPSAAGSGLAVRSMDATGEAVAPSAAGEGEADVAQEGSVTTHGTTTAPSATGSGEATRAMDATGAATVPSATGAGAADTGEPVAVAEEEGNGGGPDAEDFAWWRSQIRKGPPKQKLIEPATVEEVAEVIARPAKVAEVVEEVTAAPAKVAAALRMEFPQVDREWERAVIAALKRRRDEEREMIEADNEFMIGFAEALHRRA